MTRIAPEISRLGDLIDLAATATEKFERAAIANEATDLVIQLEAQAKERGLELGVDLEYLRWGICAAVGYDKAGGRSALHYRVIARGALQDVAPYFTE